MKSSAGKSRLVLSVVFGLGCLGWTALLLQNHFPVNAQTEKLQLVGKNFSDAQSAARQQPVADPSQLTTELAVDDGTPEAAVGAMGGGTVTGLNRLTPTSYPSTITSVLLFFQSQQGLPPTSPITILVGTNPSGGANINNIAFSQQISAVVETTGSFYLYPVTPVTINSGDFVVGFRATHAAGVLPLAVDRTSSQRRSYVPSGTGYGILDTEVPGFGGNFLIRARVQAQPPGCPTVSGISTPGGAVGTQVTITGTNFTGVTSVRFTNNVAAQFTVNGSTQITATVPPGAVTGPITIGKPNCPDIQTTPFAVNTGPPGELAVDDGSFETTQGLSNGGTSHRVNRLTPPSYPATLNAVSIFWRSNSQLNVGDQLTVVFGANPGGGTNINGLQLQTLPGTVQALATFNVYNVPALTINSGDFVVGYQITHADGVFPFALDTTPPSQQRSYRSTNNGATFAIIDTVGTAGNYGIRARLQGATQNCPTVSGINPASGAVGGQVTITGANFTGVSAVRFANNVNASFTINSDTQITATVPSGAVSGPLTISKPNCPDVQTTSFTIAQACPAIAGINPANGTVGSQVTITGNNFTGVSAVRFTGGVNAQFTINSNTQITATVPAGAVSGPLTISKPNCPDVQTSAFTVSTGPTTELMIDDGTFEASTGSSAGSLTMVNRLTPTSYPATLNGVAIFFRSSDGVQTGAPLTLLAGAYAGSDTSFLSGINFQSTPATVQALGQFNVYTVPNLTINAGDFVVGFRMAHSSGVRPFVIDQTPPRRARSYLCTENPTDCLNTENIGGVNIQGNLGIRAWLASGTAPTTITTVSAASFLGNELASEAIGAGFGANLSTATEIAMSLPLPTTLAGLNLKLRDSANREQLAGFFFASPGQLNYLLPSGLANGLANVTLMRGETVVATGTIRIAAVAPGLFAANANGQGVAAAVVFRRRADGSESFEPVARFDAAQNRFVAVPIDLGPETDQVFLILYGTGFRFRSSLAATSVTLGGVNSEVLFAGDAPGFVGLDQANVRLSRSLIGRGEVDVVLTVDGKAANNVRIATK